MLCRNEVFIDAQVFRCEPYEESLQPWAYRQTLSGSKEVRPLCGSSPPRRGIGLPCEGRGNRCEVCALWRCLGLGRALLQRGTGIGPGRHTSTGRPSSMCGPLMLGEAWSSHGGFMSQLTVKKRLPRAHLR